MFLRRCKRKKNGKQHIYWALVESYRTARGSRQRVVAYLGELKGNEQNGWIKNLVHSHRYLIRLIMMIPQMMNLSR